jgi:hypothetical protein
LNNPAGGRPKERRKMNTNENVTGDNWSLWDVEALGTLLLTEDGGNVLVQIVDVEFSSGTPIAVSRSPSAKRTAIKGEGAHPKLFETALANHLEIFEVERAAASRIAFEDLTPVAAAPISMGYRP